MSKIIKTLCKKNLDLDNYEVLFKKVKKNNSTSCYIGIPKKYIDRDAIVLIEK